MNLAKIVHFQELDGLIEGHKTKTGLFYSNIGENIHNNIIKFSKFFNEFGDATYNLSSSTFLKIISNKRLDNKFDDEVEIIEIPDKNIVIRVYANYLLRSNKASNLQIIVYDSPLISIESNGKKDESSDSVNIFINIILYNEKNEEIPIKNIEDNYKVEILYLKSVYDSLKKCFYYNEKKKELETDGILVKDDVEYNGENYFRCASSHLTAFTAGTYYFNSKLPYWAMLLIVGAILLLLIVFVLLFIIIKKKKNKERFDNIYLDVDRKESILSED